MSQQHAVPATDLDTATDSLARDMTTPSGQPRHQNEQNLRAPVAAPEAGIVDAARPEPKAPEAGLVAPDVISDVSPLMPVPVKETPKLPQALVGAAPVAANDEKDVRTRAEEALAAYVGAGLSDELKKDLKLDVLPVVGYGATGIKLCFHGPHVTTLAPMLNEALIGNNNGLLPQHPVLSKFFHQVAELPKIEITTDGSQMYHVVIPMTVDTYRSTLAELAGDVPHVQAAAAPAAVAAPDAVQASEAMQASTDAMPQNVVQAPIAALDKALDAQAVGQSEIQGAAR